MFNLFGQEEAIRTKDGDLTHFQPVICTTNSDSDGHPGAGNAITQLQQLIDNLPEKNRIHTTHFIVRTSKINLLHTCINLKFVTDL